MYFIKSILLHIITSYILSFPTTPDMINNQMTRRYSPDNYITETSDLLYLLQQIVHKGLPLRNTPSHFFQLIKSLHVHIHKTDSIPNIYTLW